MKIAVSTIGRFHHFHLARQLYRRGVLSAIFSGYPWYILQKENVPQEFVESFPWLQSIYMALNRLPFEVPRIGRPLCRLANWSLDSYVSRKLPPCDVFVGMSSCSLKAGQAQQARGGVYVCDRPCSHIRTQDELLKKAHLELGLPYLAIDPKIVEREEEEYKIADAIMVGSNFARNSFLDRGFDPKKVHCVPYGADLRRFSKAGRPADDSFEVLFVGQLCVRKGIPFLLEAFQIVEHPNKRLTLVGSISDNIKPILRSAIQSGNVRHLGYMPQAKLKEVMSVSHVFVLPSIEDGFGMVIPEAMACSCPVIASYTSGGPDIIQHGMEGLLINAGVVSELTEALQFMADNPEYRSEMAVQAERKAQNVGGWDRYGDQMVALLEDLCADNNLNRRGRHLS